MQEQHINQSNTLELLHPISFLLKTEWAGGFILICCLCNIFMWFTSDLHEFNSIWKCLMHVQFQQGVCYMIHTGLSCMAHSDASVCVRVYVCVWDQCGRRSLETACRNTRHTHSSLFQVPGIFCNHLYCSFNCSSRCLRKATGMFNTYINKGNY